MILDYKYQILAEGDPTIWNNLAEEIQQKYEVNVIKPPTVVLVMMRAKESVEELIFNVGDVLITECVVEINSQRGWGYIIGDKPQLALSIAIIDAAINAKLPIVKKIIPLFEQQYREISKKKLEEFCLVKTSMVEFEVMEG